MRTGDQQPAVINKKSGAEIGGKIHFNNTLQYIRHNRLRQLRHTLRKGKEKRSEKQTPEKTGKMEKAMHDSAFEKIFRSHSRCPPGRQAPYPEDSAKNDSPSCLKLTMNPLDTKRFSLNQTIGNKTANMMTESKRLTQTIRNRMYTNMNSRLYGITHSNRNFSDPYYWGNV
ncbi:MAG: hypothetical protein JJU05_01335 [Verrucomicrobia bacterium]|nr:hypothetical protein [Verrucomicrobiota bacterium]MCH8525874.1 hypothetical protein [Kiritimatiellia bacterium]